MSDHVCHEAAIAIAKLRCDGAVTQPIQALLDRIEELEREADENALEIAKLEHIRNVAWDAVDYHRAGKFDDPLYQEMWDADIMLSRMDELDQALTTEPRP